MATVEATGFEHLEDRFTAALPTDVDYASIRFSEARGEYLTVRQGVLEPVTTSFDVGVMVTVWAGGGYGYAATSDLTADGLAAAVERARAWAATTVGRGVLAEPPLDHPVGTYASVVERSWDTTTLAERVELLVAADAALAGPGGNPDDRIVDRRASLARIDTDSLILTSGGGRIEQRIRNTYPGLVVTANEGSNTQMRTHGRGSYVGQGGQEVLDRYEFDPDGVTAERLVTEVLQLLDADNCPTDTMDLVLAPDQMILQIHESIGHPLELDRILGDERNYAGTSFVTPDMFGSYRYGSDLLNVTFDPNVGGQLASYGFDDEGTVAAKEYLIRDGILQRPLGGAMSQARADLPGVANSRACSWNRPPIDRMANLNIEPGSETFDELIAGVERGVYLETNNSWSIDDSRNKFQFGCELGRLIVDGELGAVVRNPGYRGISATFWRNLTGVADADSFTVMGTPNCGKGEPNQMVGTGHASPACRFAAVEVFGGER